MLKYRIYKNHVHKWRGTNRTILGFKKRILICYQCGKLYSGEETA